MRDRTEDYTVEFMFNNSFQSDVPYHDELRAVLNETGLEVARAEIAAWPGYAPTPLIALPGLAAAAGFAELWYKDEGPRFRLGSFKALGGAYAVCRLLRRQVAERIGCADVSTAALLSGEYLVFDRKTEDLARFDVVVLRDPHRPGERVTRRIAGLPGERHG